MAARSTPDDRRDIHRENSSSKRKAAYCVIKRALDIILSLAVIIATCVPMLLISLLIRIESPGSAIFRQKRIGRDCKVFTLYKFRSMYCTAPSETATIDLADSSVHITRIGAFLRKTSLDELPQMFNVLKGDMSIVGPRPLIVSESIIHELRRQSGVYSIRPGITGWAQVNGRDCITVEKKAELDAEYLRKLSFAMDMRIIIGTVFVVSSGEGYAEGDELQCTAGVPELNEADLNVA